MKLKYCQRLICFNFNLKYNNKKESVSIEINNNRQIFEWVEKGKLCDSLYMDNVANIKTENIPFADLKYLLKRMDEAQGAFGEEVIITHDERVLLMSEIFGLDKIYIHKNGITKKISDCTSKELRNSHNLFNMYIAGAFNFDD